MLCFACLNSSFDKLVVYVGFVETSLNRCPLKLNPKANSDIYMYILIYNILTHT